MNLSELDKELKEVGCISWLLEKGVIDEIKICPTCGKNVKLNFERVSYRCNNYNCNCRHEFSLGKNTFFYNCKMSLENLVKLLYCFVYSYSNKDIMRELRVSEISITKYKKNISNHLSPCWKMNQR